MKNTTLVGCGALGSHVALFLRNETMLKVIDFDRVDQKNVLAQLHPKGTIGRNKAESLKQTLHLLYGLRLEAIPHKLTKDNATALLDNTDLIIDALDNGAGRRIIQDYVRASTPPRACLHGALAPDGQFGQVVWDEQFRIDDESTVGQATCEGGEFLPFIGTVSSYLAYAAQRFLLNGTKLSFQIHPRGAVRV